MLGVREVLPFKEAFTKLCATQSAKSGKTDDSCNLWRQWQTGPAARGTIIRQRQYQSGAVTHSLSHTQTLPHIVGNRLETSLAEVFASKSWHNTSNKYKQVVLHKFAK